jgi:hypothetical protein
VCAVDGCGQPSTTVDHVIPLARGGPRLARHNLVGMCGPHNFSKGDRLLNIGPPPDEVCWCGTSKPPDARRCVACEFFMVEPPQLSSGSTDD